MSASTIAWPSASTLIARAETSLGILRLATIPATTDARPQAIDLGDLEARLLRLEACYHALVPPGYESAGPFAPVKRLMKRTTRRLMWWYVEPRWDVQRHATAELAGFLHASIDALRLVSADVQELRACVDAAGS